MSRQPGQIVVNNVANSLDYMCGNTCVFDDTLFNHKGVRETVLV